APGAAPAAARHSWLGGKHAAAAPAPEPATTPSSAPAPAASAAPAPRSAPEQMAQPPQGSGMVWVNLPTGIYHHEGDRWYGKTKNGKYMTEAEAIRQGYRAAKNGGKSGD